MKKPLTALCCAALLFLSACAAPAPTPPPEPAPSTALSRSIWKAEPYGDRGEALLFLDLIAPGKAEIELYLGQYVPVDGTDLSGLECELINAAGDGDLTSLLCKGGLSSAWAGFTMELSGGEEGLSISWSDARFREGYYGELCTDDGAALSGDNGFRSAELALPTIFTPIDEEELTAELMKYTGAVAESDPETEATAPSPEDIWSCIEYADVVRTEIALPVPDRAAWEELRSVFGEPLDAHTDAFGVNPSIFFENASVSLEGLPNGLFRISGLRGFAPEDIPLCAGLGIGSGAEEILVALAPGLDYEDILAAAPETGVLAICADEREYPFSLFCALYTQRGEPSAIRYSVQSCWVTYYLADGIVSEVGYGSPW